MNRRIKGAYSYIAAAIVLLALSLFFVASLYVYGMVVQRNEVERVQRKYMLMMEREGYLSPEKEVLLLTELTSLGVTDINLDGTSRTPVGYGNELCLVIKGKKSFTRLQGWARQIGEYDVDITRTGTALY